MYYCQCFTKLQLCLPQIFYIGWLSVVKSDMYFIMEKINDVDELGKCRMEFFLNGLLGSVCFLPHRLAG